MDHCVWCLVSDIQHSLECKHDIKLASSAQVSTAHSLRFHTPTSEKAEPCQILKPLMKALGCCMQAFAALQAHKSLSACLPAQLKRLVMQEGWLKNAPLSQRLPSDLPGEKQLRPPILSRLPAQDSPWVSCYQACNIHQHHKGRACSELIYHKHSKYVCTPVFRCLAENACTMLLCRK